MAANPTLIPIKQLSFTIDSNPKSEPSVMARKNETKHSL